ncbi:Protein similar to cobyrinic acid a,c-diamide synthetase clustered with dissimilatory sulfite reductase [Olavius algarvensis Delta 1 endosymbiont]|nr:Protein similar to cobyrinic acid a,c-diamide synthetase clustered with dissimilatory sulfite reductase [Olavius algarvensis Delta 1 endosymbiont]
MQLAGTEFPRLIIAALRGGSGKTILSIGVIAALHKRGQSVAAFKKGPDYIDAGWLALAAGRPCYNLDSFLLSPSDNLHSFLSHSTDNDISIIEGNRGLYDGIDLAGSTSTAELAKLIKCPVVLGVDCTKITRTMAAVVAGCSQFDPDVMIRGVILNRVANARHEKKLRDSIEHYCGMPVIGAVPKLDEQHFPERHLGLVPTPEHDWANHSIGAIAKIAEQHIDLEALIAIARDAPGLDGRDQRTEGRGQRPEGRGQRSEDRGQRTEDRGQKTEVRGQKTEDRGQKTEDRGQNTEYRRQRSEDRRQRTDDRLQTSEAGNKSAASDKLRRAKVGMRPATGSGEPKSEIKDLNTGNEVSRPATTDLSQASSIESPASSNQHRATSIEHRASSSQQPASSIEHRASSIEHRASSIQHPVSSIQHRASSIQHPETRIEKSALRIGVIKDSAFQFYYPENIDALGKDGAEIVYVSPLKDRQLPRLHGLYIGGGFPETHAEQLAANADFNSQLKALAEDGFPIYAECGGLMYLGEQLVLENKSYPMVGILPVTFDFFKRPQGHGYTIIKVEGQNPYYDVGSEIKGHEFHYSRVSQRDSQKSELVFRMQRGAGIEKDRDGILYKNVLATYTHVHALGTPGWAPALVRNALNFQTR